MNIPTLFHITHWKAGSQWVAKVLKELFPDEIIPPRIAAAQVLQMPIQEHKVYLCVYIAKGQWDQIQLPKETRRFLIIRDLRDTLVSAYFSMRYSHPIMINQMEEWRNFLRTNSLRDGMVYLMENWLPDSANIQRSWLKAGEKFFRFEDILKNDIVCFEKILIDHCQLPIEKAVLHDIVRRNRFNTLSKGRNPGAEDRLSHYRKGLPGDWQNYFSEETKKEFKKRFNDVLILTGYADNDTW